MFGAWWQAVLDGSSDATPPPVPNAPGVGYTINQRTQYTLRDGKTQFTTAGKTQYTARPEDGPE